MSHKPGHNGLPKTPASSDFLAQEGTLTLSDTTSEQSLGAFGLSADEIAAVSRYTAFEPQPTTTDKGETGSVTYEDAARIARESLENDVHNEVGRLRELVKKTGDRPERFRITPRLLLSDETSHLDQAMEAQRAAAAKRTPATQTTADRYSSESTGDNNELVEDLVNSLTSEDLDALEIDELVTDVDDLQNVTKLALYKGLVDHSNTYYDKSEALLQAATLLTEATKSVPGFDPRKAGVDELKRHAVVNEAFFRHDGGSMFFSGEDPTEVMSAACLEAVAEIDTELIRRGVKISPSTRPLPVPIPGVSQPEQDEVIWPAESGDLSFALEAEADAHPQQATAEQPAADAPPAEQTAFPSEETLGTAESAEEWFQAARDAAKGAVREAFDQAVSEQAGVIRKHVPHEPGNNGYWELAGTYGSEERKLYEEVKETQRRVSSQKLPSTYNELDEYVLDLVARTDTPWYLAERLADHVAGTNEDGRKIESFVDNTAELQTITKLLVLEGLREQSLQPYRYDEHMTLLPALRLLTEATKNIPDFDPAEAGWDALETHTLFQRALLKLESPHWTYNRIRDQRVGDPAYRTTGACANAIAEIGTAVALRNMSIRQV
jgi:hypothetical protein